jgi:hypothetical protein
MATNETEEKKLDDKEAKLAARLDSVNQAMRVMGFPEVNIDATPGWRVENLLFVMEHYVKQVIDQEIKPKLRKPYESFRAEIEKLDFNLDFGDQFVYIGTNRFKYSSEGYIAFVTFVRTKEKEFAEAKRNAQPK